MPTRKSLWTILLLLLFSTTVTITPGRAAVPQQELAALVDLYNKTQGWHWTNKVNWNNGDPCTNNWYGVSCNAENTHVTRLNLPVNNLNGTLPASIGNLANLQFLYLYSNQLTGSIPSSIGNLQNLQKLSLYDNRLSGNIPRSIGNLANLQELWLDSNQLSESIPASIGNLASLERVTLSYNQLSGTIPASIGSLTNLKYLFLDNNLLSGTIPTSIGNLANLRILSLHHNQLCGVIPATLMNLTNLYNGSGLSLYNNNLDTDVSPELDAFISQKSSGNWKNSQGTVEYCRRSDFPWPMFLPAITTPK